MSEGGAGPAVTQAAMGWVEAVCMFLQRVGCGTPQKEQMIDSWGWGSVYVDFKGWGSVYVDFKGWGSVYVDFKGWGSV